MEVDERCFVLSGLLTITRGGAFGQVKVGGHVDNPLRQNPNYMVLQCTLFKCIVLDRHLETHDQTVRYIPKRVQNPSHCHLSHP